MAVSEIVIDLLPALRSTVDGKLSPLKIGAVVSDVPPLNVIEVGKSPECRQV